MTLLALDPGVEQGLQLTPSAIKAMVRTHEVARHLVDKHLGDALRHLVPLRAKLLPKQVGGQTELQAGVGLGEGDGLVLEVVFDVIQGHALVVGVCCCLGDGAISLQRA